MGSSGYCMNHASIENIDFENLRKHAHPLRKLRAHKSKQFFGMANGSRAGLHLSLG
jgi:hypothetical protein